MSIFRIRLIHSILHAFTFSFICMVRLIIWLDQIASFPMWEPGQAMQWYIWGWVGGPYIGQLYHLMKKSGPNCLSNKQKDHWWVECAPQHKNYYPNEMHNSSSNIFACHQPCNSVDNGWMKEEKLLLYVFSTLLGLICTQRRVNTTTDYCVMFLFAILLVCKLLTMACCP